MTAFISDFEENIFIFISITQLGAKNKYKWLARSIIMLFVIHKYCIRKSEVLATDIEVEMHYIAVNRIGTVHVNVTSDLKLCGIIMIDKMIKAVTT